MMSLTILFITCTSAFFGIGFVIFHGLYGFVNNYPLSYHPHVIAAISLSIVFYCSIDALNNVRKNLNSYSKVTLPTT